MQSYCAVENPFKVLKQIITMISRLFGFSRKKSRNVRRLDNPIKVLRFSGDYLIIKRGLQIGLQDLNRAMSEFEDICTHQVFTIKPYDWKQLILSGEVISTNGKYWHERSKTWLNPIIFEFEDDFAQLNRLEYSKEYLKQLPAIFDLVKPDLVHIHGSHLRVHTQAARIAKQIGATVVCTWHGSGAIKDSLLHIHRQTEKFVDFALGVCKDGLQIFEKPSKSKVIYGVDTCKFSDSTLVQKVRGPNWDKSFVFFYPACYSSQKNQLQLISEFKKLIDDGFDVRLHCMGQTHDRDELYYYSVFRLVQELKLNDKVLLSDYENQSVVRNWYYDSDCVVLPSIGEGRSRTMIEAFSCGCLVIASDDAGMLDNMSYNQKICAVGFNSNNKGELYDAMRLVVSDSSRFQDLGIRAKRFAEQELNIEKCAREHYDLYKSILIKNT